MSRFWRWLFERGLAERDPTLDAVWDKQDEIEARLEALGIDAEVRGRGKWLPTR